MDNSKAVMMAEMKAVSKVDSSVALTAVSWVACLDKSKADLTVELMA